jgi:hypothetical protein
MSFPREFTALNFVAAPAATYLSQSLPNEDGRGVRVYIKLVTATLSSVVFTVEGYDVASDTWYTLLVSAAKTTAASTVLVVYPTITASANLIAQDAIPPQIRVKAVLADNGGTAALTGTVGVAILK